MDNEPKIPILLRLDREKVQRFKDIQGHRGALPQFVEDCLAAFIAEWGDRPTQRELTLNAVRSVIQQRG